MSIRNKLLFNSFMKKTKQKKCKDCKYAYIKGNIFACKKSGYYIEPLHLICFRKKTEEDQSMENEIKVGEYIRTKLGDIKQITEGFEFIIERHNKSSNNIVKHSSNLIDIIEERRLCKWIQSNKCNK